jgi:hypothetical protein
MMVPPVIEQGVGVPTIKFRFGLVTLQLVSRKLNPVPETNTTEPRGPRFGLRVTRRGTISNVAEAELPGGPPPVTIIV